MRKKFMVGIDLGTDSCGFCLCDENSHIVKKNGKYLWGARLFDEASDAKDRRTARNSRRRLARRNKRIQFLQELMASEIAKVDEKFFKRLQFSQLQKEDKVLKKLDFHQTLFNDSLFTDKEYYKKYPTIYHLKSDLMSKKDEKFDIRLIYLALAHYMKHRGHFLEDNIKIENGNLDFKQLLFDNLSILKEKLELDIDVEEASSSLKEYLENNKKIKADFLKENILKSNKEEDQDKINKVFIKLLVQDKGLAYKDIFKVLLEDTIYEDEEDEEILKTKLSLNSETFEDDLDKFYTTYLKYSDDEDIKDVIALLYDINNNGKLVRLLGDSKTISEANVKKYEEHEKQLKEFKKYIKENKKGLYKQIFYPFEEKKEGKSVAVNNYASYVGSNINGNKKDRYCKCTIDEFYAFLKKKLELDKVQEETNPYLFKIKQLIDDKEFLVKQRTNSNSVFPYQLSEYEIKVILKNQSKFYPFLSEKDEYGTIAEKIIKIFSYKIPYYYGPISRNKNINENDYSWAILNEDRKDLKVRPWNIQDIIDEKKTNEKFIQRLQNKCSYLHDKYCLPKQSPLIQLFNVLNELNKITVSTKPLSTEEKLELLKNVYLNNLKVSEKDIKQYFKSKTNLPSNEITIQYLNNNGKAVQFNSNLSMFVRLCSILNLTEHDKDVYLTSGYIKRIEDIVYAIAIYEDKNLLQKYLEDNKVVLNLTSEQIKSLKGISSTGFSRLSKDLLIDLKPIEDGPSIIEEMINSNNNFMEIVEKEDSPYKLAIDKHNKEYLDENKSNQSKDEIVKEYVENMYVSPGMKRPLIQAYKIIEELKKIVSSKEGQIEEYYIECTRTNQAKKEQTKSRKDTLKSLYESAEKDCLELNQELRERFESENDNRFNSDKIYLYYLQLGIDIYTREQIDYDSLEKDYDIDHIFPQSKFKDDSLNNRVLVKKSVNNGEKGDIYPIPYENFHSKYSVKQINDFQEKLLKAKLISKEKYNRLTRKTELTEDEINNFVSRQIVFTSQSVKALKELIETFEPKSKVIMSKAENISDFRKNFDIVKARDANNLHHAHDAFLNVVVGRLINEYFTNKWYLKSANNGKKFTSNVNKIFYNFKDVDKDDFYDKDNNLVWRYKNNETIKYIDNQIYQNHNILVTTRTYEKSKMFEKVSIKPAKELNDTALPIKQTLSLKYGGYSDMSFNYYTLIKTTSKKGEVEFKVVTYPGLYKVNSSQSKKLKEYNLKKQKEYILSAYKVDDYEIVLDDLKINTIFEIDNSRFCITGKTGSRYVIKNLKEAFYSKESIKIIKKVSKLMDVLVKKGYFNKITNNDFLEKNKFRFINDNEYIISPARNDECKEITITRDELYYLYDEIIKILSSKIYQSYALNNLANSKDKLSIGKDKLNDLSILDLVKLVYEALKLTQTNRENPDLNLIDDKKKSANSGNLTISPTLPKGIKIIYQSVTGYYSKVVWENK